MRPQIAELSLCSALTSPAIKWLSCAATPSINPATPVVIKASNGTLSSVTVTNKVKGTHVTGDFSSDKSTWTSNEDLGYGASYAVAAVGANSAGKSVTQNSTVTTLKPAKVVYPNMIPAPASVTR